MAFFMLPVAPLPNVDLPIIMVQAQLPGASPATMASSVALPLERHLQTIAGLNEMTSQSGVGSASVILQFDFSRNVDGAARDVQAAINAARADLPTTLKNNPSYVKANPNQAPILIIAMTSPTRTPAQIYDAVSNIVIQKLSAIDGVGEVELGGATLPATRVDINPLALSRYGISLEDARAAISTNNANRPKGVLDFAGHSAQIYTNKAAQNANDYKDMIVAYRSGRAVRLSDVAHVYDGPEDIRNMGLFNGKPAVMLLIRRQPGANIIATVDALKAKLPELQSILPKDIHINISSDRTTTIRGSLHDVEVSLIFATLLVVLVVSLFLRSWGATIVPAVAVIVSIAGTLSAMALLGFSLNNFSLMALTIATGFVVDDAIVVLENISRYVEAGMKPFQAALRGAREVGFTVVSISVSLVAVFIPILFASGIQGKLFYEFGMTITAAVMISLVISLTTTPMIASLMLKYRPQHDDTSPHKVSLFLERGFQFFQNNYARSLDWALSNRGAMLVVLLGCVLLTGLIAVKIPKGFFPEQDTGGVMGGLRADRSISFDAMSVKLKQIAGIIGHDPGVQNVVAFTGGRRAGGGFLFVTLKPVHQRDSARVIISRLRPPLGRITGVSAFLNPMQDIQTGGRGGNSMYQYTLEADNAADLNASAAKLTKALKKDLLLTDVDLDMNDSAAEDFVTIDRNVAARLGISNTLIDGIFYDAYGQRQIATIYSGINQYHVVMGVDPKFQSDPSALNSLFMPTKSAVVTGISQKADTMTPLFSFAQSHIGSAASEINHSDASPSSTISFSLAGATSLGDAAKEIEKVSSSLGLPASVHGDFSGTAKTFGQSSNATWMLILAAFLVIYIVLGILYENLLHPITVLSTLPSALMGGALALLVSGGQLDMIAVIGMLLLIGIVKKNAIMIIDFALIAEREQGLSPREAIRQAALLRFRPILMTTLAAGFGALPLALGYGDGAELRRPLGVVIIGGLIASQIISLLTTPVVYLALDSARRYFKRKPAMTRLSQAIS